ncbi:hypothetical protein OGX91_20665 [Citrobacter sp. Cpa228]|nr:hypothetical protein [Citrobacter sp. Cpa228]MDM2926583.1 hypothetical protein [Citrobacter sp. Cpa228]
MTSEASYYCWNRRHSCHSFRRRYCPKRGKKNNYHNRSYHDYSYHDCDMLDRQPLLLMSCVHVQELYILPYSGSPYYSGIYLL